MEEKITPFKKLRINSYRGPRRFRDAFAGGLIYGLLHMSPKDAVEFAMAAGVLKHSVPGDILYCSLQEIQELVAGEGNGKIKR